MSDETDQESLAFAPVNRPTQRQAQLIRSACTIDETTAQSAGAMGYIAKTMAFSALPLVDPKLPPGQVYFKDIGRYTLSIAPSSRHHGIPYGTIPRILLAWICTEAVKTQNRVLDVGKSQAEFLRRLDMKVSGRDYIRFSDQAHRLFKATMATEVTEQDAEYNEGFRIAERVTTFWTPQDGAESRWCGSLTLSTDFYAQIVKSPIPFDFRVFQALSKSPLSMDIYVWLTHRMFVLQVSGQKVAYIPWSKLMLQFGSGYTDTPQARSNFKSHFLKRLREVLVFYPAARKSICDDKENGNLVVRKTRLHLEHSRVKKS